MDQIKYSEPLGVGTVCENWESRKIPELLGQIWDHSKKSKNETDESWSAISDFLIWGGLSKRTCHHLTCPSFHGSNSDSDIAVAHFALPDLEWVPQKGGLDWRRVKFYDPCIGFGTGDPNESNLQVLKLLRSRSAGIQMHIYTQRGVRPSTSPVEFGRPGSGSSRTARKLRSREKPSNWYESVGPVSTKWPAEGLIPESGWMGGFSLKEMKDGVDAMKSVFVDFAPSPACRILDINLIIFGGSRPQVGHLVMTRMTRTCMGGWFKGAQSLIIPETAGRKAEYGIGDKRYTAPNVLQTGKNRRRFVGTHWNARDISKLCFQSPATERSYFRKRRETSGENRACREKADEVAAKRWGAFDIVADIVPWNSTASRLAIEGKERGKERTE
ncbi:hypothetical protein B0H13DRAFT_1932567 [Mycena leptocephala]|nr:hypothetical protein B0H13DRAFT_1932567 [Mycena leptocephala]